MSQTEKALLPCPFCGGEAEFEREGTSRHSCIVVCTNCGARHESGDQDGHSGSSWNRRAALLDTQAEPAPDGRSRSLSRAELTDIKDTLEYWITRVDRRGMSECDYKSWRALGFDSKAMRTLLTLLAAAPAAPTQAKPSNGEGG